MDDYSNVVSRFFDWCRTGGLDFLVNTLVATIVFCIGLIVTRLLHWTTGRLLSKRGLNQKLRVRLILNLVNAAWWMFVIFVVFLCYHINILPMLAGFGVAGIVVGFAFQESLSSLAAGAMMSFSDPFEVGDEVTVSGYSGIVKSFGYTSIVIRAADGRLITIPNKQVWGSEIVNHTREKLRRVDRQVSIGYGADIPKSLDIIRGAVTSMNGVLSAPEPSVWVSDLADSAVVVTVQVWVKTADYWPIWRTIYPVIKRALDENGVPIPFPQLDVHLSHEDK